MTLVDLIQESLIDRGLRLIDCIDMIVVSKLSKMHYYEQMILLLLMVNNYF